VPRTQQEFDKWFAESGGDPWHYDSPFVTDRLQKSLSFIQRYLSRSFQGTFIEIGAFNGAFSARLAEAFPHSLVIANDISEIAIQQARETTLKYNNIVFDRSDMMNFKMPNGKDRHERALLLMESLYYLPLEERPGAIRHLLTAVQPKMIFVSGPIHGDRYFSEESLIEEFRGNGFILSGVSILNMTDEFRSLPNPPRLPKFWGKQAFRRKYGRQVMYRFRPNFRNRKVPT
jgi:SAM-dependent methyltransferase